MDCEVAVVGGGIGGLTVAALLSQRGVDVCLLERESQLGGCAAGVEKFGFTFDPSDGLYSGWAAGDIHSRIFAELPVAPPETRLIQPGYVVGLPDGSAVSVAADLRELEDELVRVFPECSEQALAFYRKLSGLSLVLRNTLDRNPNFLSSSSTRKALSLATHGASGLQILKCATDTAIQHLHDTSIRFRRFIDIQLQTLGQGDSSQVSYLYAALALFNPDGIFEIRGGAGGLAQRLGESVTRSGGRIRLNSPVLRLSYNSAGDAEGVDLLSGETVRASRAVVSNLTFWDTYGKLIGLNRTPTAIRKHMNALRGWGAYLVYAGIEDAAAATLTGDHLLQLTDWQEDSEYDPETAQFTVAIAPAWDPRAPKGKRAVTIHAFTDVDRWFTFHRDETEHEEADQEMLEAIWKRLHQALPELGSGIEVIDTATPRTYYEQTRRKLGMVGGLPVTPEIFWQSDPAYLTSLPNVLIVSDTSSLGGLAGVTNAALLLANHLQK